MLLLPHTGYDKVLPCSLHLLYNQYVGVNIHAHIHIKNDVICQSKKSDEM